MAMNVQEFKVIGHFSPQRCEEFIEMVLDVTSNKPEKIIIDLSGCTFIDSKGLSTLVKVYKQLKDLDINMIVSGAAGKVKHILEITMLERIFSPNKHE